MMKFESDAKKARFYVWEASMFCAGSGTSSPDVHGGCRLKKPLQSTLTFTVACVMSQMGQSSVEEAIRYEGNCVFREAIIAMLIGVMVCEIQETRVVRPSVGDSISNCCCLSIGPACLFILLLDCVRRSFGLCLTFCRIVSAAHGASLEVFSSWKSDFFLTEVLPRARFSPGSVESVIFIFQPCFLDTSPMLSTEKVARKSTLDGRVQPARAM